MAGNLTAMIAAAFAGGVVSDPYFEYTTLLLPGNGINGAQNNTFLDSGTANSGSGFTITRNGNTTQGTFSPFSQTGWGNYFSGSSQYLTAPSNSAFNFSTNDFTIECWVYLTAYSANWSGSYTAAIISRDANTGASSGRNYWVNLNGTSSSWTGLSFGFFSGSTYSQKSESYAFSLNTWYNIAVVRSSGQVNFYVNGSVVGSGTTMSSAPNTNAIPLYIGQQGYSTAEYYFPGYISNLRLVNGVAVYTGNFTPPTSALTATQSAGPSGSNIQAITTGQTKLLTCQSNRFVDNGQGNTSNTPFTLTVYGTPSVQAFSPFNPTSSWSAVTNGGSGYFDGTGDYLTTGSEAAFGVGSGNFTIECWVYLSSNFNSTGRGIITAAYNTNFALIGVNSGAGNKVDFYVANTNMSSGTNYISLNSWTHIACVRSSGTTKIYFNGVEVGSSASLTGTGATAAVYVGTLSHDTTGTMNGYIADARIVKGTAVYTAAFTPPTAPLTNITNTSLLLNFTNAGIYDATSKNDLETVGDAKISTTQSKWGGSSMAFDGTGDYLTARLGPDNVLAGDFTVEMWVYPTTITGSNRCFVLLENGNNSPSFFMFGATGYIGLDIANITTYTFGSTAVTTNSWQHIAFVRSGSTITAYINGNLVGTATDSRALGASGIMVIGSAGGGAAPYAGYIDDLRITKGYARYTANFTPPTAAFPTL